MDVARLALVVDSSGLTRAGTDLNKFGAQADKAGVAARGMSKAVAGLAAAAAGMAATFVTSKLFGSAIREAEQLERNMFRTNAIIKATGGAAGRTARQLHEQARAMARLTLESTEGIMRAQQTLLTFRNVTGDVFDSAMEAANDMSAALGTDLNSAVLQLGKALEDPITGMTALTRSGTVFTEAQKKMVKGMVEAGDTMSAQKFILGELAAQYGGVAAAEAAGLAGAQDDLAQSAQEFSLKLNDVLGLTAMATAANLAMANGLDFMAGHMDELVGIVAAATGALVLGYLPAIVSATAATGVWIASLVTVRGALMATGIGALVVGAGLLIGKFLQLVRATGGWGNAIAALGELASAVWDGIKTSASSIGPALASVWETVKSGFYSMLEAISSKWSEFLFALGAGLSNIPGFSDIADTINEAAGNAFEGMSRYNGLAAAADTQTKLLRSSASSLADEGFEKIAAAVAKINKLLKDAENEFGENSDEAGKLRKQLDALNDELGDNGTAGGAKKAAEAVKELTNEMEGPLGGAVDNLADAFGGLFTGAIDNFTDFRDTIVDGFKRMIAQLISMAIANPIKLSLGIGGTVAGAAGSTVLQGGGGNGVLGGIFGNLLGGGGFLSGIGAGAQAALGIGNFASAGMLNITANAATAAATGASSLSATIGAALPAIALIGGAIALIAKGLSQEYKGTAIRGTMGAGGFDGTQFDFYRGGFLRGDRADYSDVDNQITALLDDAMDAVTDSIRDMGRSLGLSVREIRNFVGDEFTLWVHNLSEQEIMEGLNSEIASVSDAMAELVLGTDEFTRAGEGAMDTLTRLAISLDAANDAIDLLGHTMFEASLVGADMASQLVDAFGGVEAMASAVGTYWGSFYTEAERQETLMRRLSEQFAELNVAMPESAEGFRAIIDGIDLTSEAGRQLYADLMGLSGALATVLGPLTGFSPEITGMINDVAGVIDVEIAARQKLAQEHAESSRLWLRTAETLRDFLTDLRTTSLGGLNPQQILEATAMRYSDIYKKARRGDQDAAGDYIGTAKAYLSAVHDTAGTALEYRRAAHQVELDAQLLHGISNFEAGKADYIAKLYEAQVETLEVMKELLYSGELTVEALDGLNINFGNLQSAIDAASLLSYDYLVENLDIIMDLAAQGDISPELAALIMSAGGSLETLIDLIFRDEELSPGMVFLLSGEVANALGILNVALGEDDTAVGMFLAGGVLEGAATLITELAAGTSDTLAALLTDGVFSVNAEILGEIMGSDAAANLLRLIGEATTNWIKVAGEFEFDPSKDLQDWFGRSLSGLGDGLGSLELSMGTLGGTISSLIGALTSAAQAEAAAIERQANIAQVQAKIDQFEGNWGANSVAQATGVIGKIRDLEAATGINLTLGGTPGNPGAAVLTQNADGTIRYNADGTTQGGDLRAFNDAFRGAGGLEAAIAAANANVNRANAYEQRLYGNLASFDGGGFTGSGSRSGGVDGKGGFPAILHPNEHVTDLTKRGGGDSAALANIAREIAALREENTRNQVQIAKYAKRQADMSRKWDEQGQPEERVL